jgi:hypothetical protein
MRLWRVMGMRNSDRVCPVLGLRESGHTVQGTFMGWLNCSLIWPLIHMGPSLPNGLAMYIHLHAALRPLTKAGEWVVHLSQPIAAR